MLDPNDADHGYGAEPLVGDQETDPRAAQSAQDPDSDGDESDDQRAEFDELEQTVGAELTDAISYIDLEIGPERALATQYYMGEPYGDEEDGRSQLVTTEVRDTVQAMMPSLMRVFFGDQNILEVIPNSSSRADFAEQAEDTLRHVVLRQNDGFKEFYSAFKDGLIRKTGFIKWWWDSGKRATVKTYENCTHDQVLVAMQQYGKENVQVVSTSTQTQQVPAPPPQARPPGQGTPPGATAQPPQAAPPGAAGGGAPPPPPAAPPGPPQMVDQEVPVYTIRVSIRKPWSQAKFIAVPPEEILINRGAVSIQRARFVAHRTIKTRSELIEMGIDEDFLEDSGSSNSTSLDFNRELQVRQPGLSAIFGNPAPGTDEDADRFEHYECYYYKDLDGDGVPELYKIQMLGASRKMIDVEPIEEVCIESFCPDPEPHVWAGLSIADRTMDLQIINSHVLRNVMDSLAASIFPRMAYVEGQVNVDDILNTEIGAAIRMRAQDMVKPLAVPFTGQQAMPVLAYLSDVREQRTGISKAAQGLDADALQSTSAVAAAATIQASQAMIELIARLFAEGFRRVMRGLLRLLIAHQDRPMVVRLRDKSYIEANPKDWDPDLDVVIDVAVGLSSTKDRLAGLAAVIEKQEGAIKAFGPQNPIAGPEQIQYSYVKFAELAGWKATERFFLPTAQVLQQQAAAAAANPQPPQPTPEELLAQTEKYKADTRAETEKQSMTQSREQMFLEDDRARDQHELQALTAVAVAEIAAGQKADMAHLSALISRDRNDASHIAARASLISAQAQQTVAESPPAPVAA